MPLQIIRSLLVYVAVHCAFAAAGFELPTVTVGSNLQTSATIKLTEPAPDAGLAITITSSDPTRLRFSKRQDAAGTGSILLEVRAGFDETPEFWLQGFGDKGEAVYTAAAPGFKQSSGTVTLTPSAIAIAGPFRAPKFQTTTGAVPSNISLYPVRLDSSLQVAQQQLLAGGLSLKVDVKSSDPAVGVITSSPVTLTASAPGITTLFKPVAPGTTNLSISLPPGFTVPAQFATISAIVRTPGIGLTNDLTIGENLQVGAVVGLGEAAPAGGVTVTITSDDPSLLLLSSEPTEVGSKSIAVKISEGGTNSRIYLQALGRSGSVAYSATAHGYVSRAAKVTLAPSGIVVIAPRNTTAEEAELLRKEGGTALPAFLSHLSKHTPASVAILMAQLDPVTLRSDNTTVQALRAGMSLKIDVENRDPAIGTVTTPVVIKGGSEQGSAEFTPLRAGSTVLSAMTPEGFTKASNSTSIKAVVQQ